MTATPSVSRALVDMGVNKEKVRNQFYQRAMDMHISFWLVPL